MESETMRVGLVLPMFTDDADRVLAFARDAQELGFDGVFAYDHLLPLGGPDDGPALESFATLAAVAAVTDRIHLGTLVARASLRPVGLLAKLATQLDLIGEGRAILAVGTGDELSRREHEAFGVASLDREERRAHLEETMLALAALFSGRPWAGGRHVPAIHGPLAPPPPTPGGPPRWVGGTGRGVVRIAARTADAWNGWALSEEGFAERTRLLADEAARHGRSVEPTWGGIVLVGRDEDETADLLAARRRGGLAVDRVWVGTADEIAARLSRLRQLGATWTILLPAGPRDRPAVIAERVVPVLRGRP